MADELAAHPSTVESTIQLVRSFNDALNAQDVDAMMRLMADDCLFDSTHPPPDGTRYEGRRSVRAYWEHLLRTTREPRISIEDIFALEDRCVMRWTYHWQDAHGNPGHVRGVDIYRVRDRLIVEKLSYVKG